MAVRIRKDGRIFCAAMHRAEEGDSYLDDGVHYYLSVERRVLRTEPMEGHAKHGQWWWAGQEPEWAYIDPFYEELSGRVPEWPKGAAC
jgi:hypothetical protein